MSQVVESITDTALSLEHVVDAAKSSSAAAGAHQCALTEHGCQELERSAALETSLARLMPERKAGREKAEALWAESKAKGDAAAEAFSTRAVAVVAAAAKAIDAQAARWGEFAVIEGVALKAATSHLHEGGVEHDAAIVEAQEEATHLGAAFSSRMASDEEAVSEAACLQEGELQGASDLLREFEEASDSAEATSVPAREPHLFSEPFTVTASDEEMASHFDEHGDMPMEASLATTHLASVAPSPEQRPQGEGGPEAEAGSPRLDQENNRAHPTATASKLITMKARFPPPPARFSIGISRFSTFLKCLSWKCLTHMTDRLT